MGYKGKKKCGCCYCFSCPLGVEAEQQDLTNKTHPDAIKDEIDWDGLCEDGEVTEGEYLLVTVEEKATEERKKAMNCILTDITKSGLMNMEYQIHYVIKEDTQNANPSN